MTIAHAMAFVDEIQMGVNVDNMNRLLVIEGPNTGNMDRMIAPQNHGQSACLQNFAHAIFYGVVALDRVGVNDIGIANIDHAHLINRQIGDVIFKIVCAAMTK